MNRPMRRKDRLMDEENIQRVLKENYHGVLATISEDLTPYANPISYIYHNGHVYFHSAAQGHKVDNMAKNENVAFTVVGRVEMKGLPKSDAYFESVIVFGRARQVLDFDEQLASMTALMEVFMPDKAHETADDLRKMQRGLKIYRIDADHVSGKLRKKAGGGH